MKKFVTSLIAFTLVSQPVMAREHYERSHRDNTGSIVAGVLGGIIIGAVVAGTDRSRRDDRYYRDDYRDDRHVPYDQYQRMRDVDAYNRYWTDPRRHCSDVTRYDYYGNPYYDRVCQ